ncbi:MAG: glycosyltransferase, partial [Planctomycetes bacterium]|nr:glycosyltransferase [Planctomycetota bacterium]
MDYLMAVSGNISPILIFTLAKQHGGAEVRVVNFASALHNKYAYAVGVIADSPLHKKLTEDHLNAVPFAYNRFDPRLLLALVRTIRSKGYKTIDMQTIQSMFWGMAAALLTRIPNVVVTVHSAYGLYKNSFKGWLYETMLRFAAHKMGGRMIAVSESVKEYLLDIGIKAERIALVHNSVRWDEQPIQNSEPSLLQSLGWGKDCFVVLVVGRLEAVKGYGY